MGAVRINTVSVTAAVEIYSTATLRRVESLKVYNRSHAALVSNTGVWRTKSTTKAAMAQALGKGTPSAPLPRLF
jgi:hypothetical protein